MGDWRYFVQRAATREWLDLNAQLTDTQFTWMLSAPNNGKATWVSGSASPIAQDGLPLWQKWKSILYAEEDGALRWMGICNAANPSVEGQDLSFVGFTGWWQKVPFNSKIDVWKTNAFDVVRALGNHANIYKPGLDIILPSNRSAFTVGDDQPPARPVAPARKKGQSVSDWQGSKPYDKYQKDDAAWVDKYGDRETFKIAWWEAPYVGEEIDQLAREIGFDYRERVEWRVRGSNPAANLYFDVADNIARRRTDIALEDGINLAAALDPKKEVEDYANHVIGLGAGEGATMLRVGAGSDDGGLYQAEYINYKNVTNASRLRALAQYDRDVLADLAPKIDTVVAWDVPGFVSLSTLLVGDQVRVISQNLNPKIDTWRTVTAIVRDPRTAVVTLSLAAA